ncbi:MAG: class I SAM-dependent RNA methyltransferase, partial [Vulcanimicrobiaceae bacterium]
MGSEHDVRFTDLLANGQGVGRVGSQVVFVWGPLPDERARIRIVEVKKSYAVGELLELVEESPQRTAPFCPVFGTCGGCQVQHLSYEAQLAWKSRLVRDALERIGGFPSVQIAPAVGMDEPRAYRNKMALVVERSGTQVEFGFYQMRSHAFVPIAACPVVLPQLDRQINELMQAAADPKLEPAFAGVKHVIARAGAWTGESVTALTTDEPSPRIAAAASGLAKRLSGTKGISNSFSPPSANAILGRKQRQVWGQSDME